MSQLLDSASALRFSLELDRRLRGGSDGPASLQARCAIERRVPAATGEAPAFAAVMALPPFELLDVHLLSFLEELERVLLGDEAAALAPDGGPLALLVRRDEAGLEVEVGLDLSAGLHPLPGEEIAAGSHLLLLRFPVSQPAAVSFCSQLLDAYGRVGPGQGIR